MPNWCNNSVTIHHTDANKMRRLVTAVNRKSFCNHVVPMPTELDSHADGWLPANWATTVFGKANIRKYGYASWYDFRIAEWGIKWDVEACDCVIAGTVQPDGVTLHSAAFHFLSAWCPPNGIYETLIKQGYYCRALYYEPLMQFAGIWDNGIIESYNVDTMTGEEFHQRAPELDDHFNIAADMEWDDNDRSDNAHAEELATLIDAESPNRILAGKPSEGGCK